MAAFETLYWRHVGGLLAYAQGMTGDRAGAEDVLQEVWVGFARRVGELAPDTNVRAYLFAAARNRLFNAARSRRREMDMIGRAAADGPTPPESGAAPDRALIAKERERLLNEALANLDELDREIVLLHARAGLTFKEIAQGVNRPLATVASRYRRAMETMRDRLTEMP